MADANNRFVDINTTTGKKILKTPLLVSTGPADGGKIPKTDPSTGKLDPSVIPNFALASIEASEALSAGDFVNCWDDAGTIKIRLADAANAIEAHGFVLDNIAAAASGILYPLGQINSALSGLTLGARYYLSLTTPGGVQVAPINPPSADIYQYLGVAKSATSMQTLQEDCILIE